MNLQTPNSAFGLVGGSWSGSSYLAIGNFNIDAVGPEGGSELSTPFPNKLHVPKQIRPQEWLPVLKDARSEL